MFGNEYNQIGMEMFFINTDVQLFLSVSSCVTTYNCTVILQEAKSLEELHDIQNQLLNMTENKVIGVCSPQSAMELKKETEQKQITKKRGKRSASPNHCSVHDRVVDLEQFDFIIAPRKINTGEAKGSCYPFMSERPGDMLAELTRDDVVLACTPTSYKAFSMLYFSDDDHHIIRKYDYFGIVATAGCQPVDLLNAKMAKAQYSAGQLVKPGFFIILLAFFNFIVRWQ